MRLPAIKETVMIALKTLLAAHTQRIKAAMGHWSKSTLLLGKELKTAREKVKAQGTNKRGWIEYLKTEIGLSVGHADAMIRAYEKFGSCREWHRY